MGFSLTGCPNLRIAFCWICLASVLTFPFSVPFFLSPLSRLIFFPINPNEQLIDRTQPPPKCLSFELHLLHIVFKNKSNFDPTLLPKCAGEEEFLYSRPACFYKRLRCSGQQFQMLQLGRCPKSPSLKMGYFTSKIP